MYKIVSDGYKYKLIKNEYKYNLEFQSFRFLNNKSEDIRHNLKRYKNAIFKIEWKYIKHKF